MLGLTLSRKRLLVRLWAAQAKVTFRNKITPHQEKAAVYYSSEALNENERGEIIFLTDKKMCKDIWLIYKKEFLITSSFITWPTHSALYTERSSRRILFYIPSEYDYLLYQG